MAVAAVVGAFILVAYALTDVEAPDVELALTLTVSPVMVALNTSKSVALVLTFGP